jgi:hypothetical protein
VLRLWCLVQTAVGQALGVVLATSLVGDVAAALREHGSVALDEHYCCSRRSDRVLVAGRRNLRSRGITHCSVTAITVTRCAGWDNSDARDPPICIELLTSGIVSAHTQNWLLCLMGSVPCNPCVTPASPATGRGCGPRDTFP